MVILRSFLCKIDKNNIARQKQNHIARTWLDSKRWSAEVFASFHFSLSRCYLSTCVAALISTCRILPSTEDVPRIIIGREKRTYTHLQCVIIVTSRVISDLDRDQGQRIVKSQTSKGKRFSEVARLTMYYLFSATRWRENPRRDRTREMREYYVRLYVESGDGDWSRSLFISLSCMARSTFFFHRTLINSRSARISFVTPFLAQASYATVCERRLSYSTWTYIFRFFFF